MNLAVVRSAEEIGRLIALDAGPRLFLCMNRASLDECMRRELLAELLDDEILRPDYKTISGWGLAQTFELIERSRGHKDLHFFLECHFMALQSLFVQTLKICLVLERLLKVHEPEELCISSDGASLFQVVAQAYTSIFRPDIRWVVLDAPSPSKTSAGGHGFKRSIYSVLGRLERHRTEGILRAAQRKGLRTLYVSGALSHLSAVTDRLSRAPGWQLVFFENAFNLEKCLYCIRRGIAFAVLPGPDPIERPDLSPALDGLRAAYHGRDLTALFRKIFAPAAAIVLPGLQYDRRALDALIGPGDRPVLLLDEEWTMRRMIAVMARMKGWRCAVVSHGIPGLPIDEEVRSRYAGRYLGSETFVNTDLEREQYLSLLYPPELIRTLGTPRYDEAYRIAHGKGKASSRGTTRTVLYCGAHMRRFDFESLMPWLGLGFVFYDNTRRYITDLTRAAKDRNARLIVKPHYNEELEWRCLLRSAAPEGVQWSVLSHRDNIFRAIADADVVVTAESTVITEAVMLAKPVIVLCYPPDELTVPYDRDGLVELARGASDLHSALARCLSDPTYADALAQKRRASFHRYAGPFDGRNAERVAAQLLSERTSTAARKAAYV